MEMVNTGHLVGPGRRPQSRILCCLYLGGKSAPIAQSVNTLNFNFERAVEGSILTAGKRLSLKTECNNSGYKLTGLTWWR